MSNFELVSSVHTLTFFGAKLSYSQNFEFIDSTKIFTLVLYSFPATAILLNWPQFSREATLRNVTIDTIVQLKRSYLTQAGTIYSCISNYMSYYRKTLLVVTGQL